MIKSFTFIFLFSLLTCLVFAQSEQLTPCPNMYVCPNTSTQIECNSSNILSAFGTNVTLDNGYYYFNSSGLIPGLYPSAVGINLNFATVYVDVHVLGGILTANGTPTAANDTIQFCNNTGGVQLGFLNPATISSVQWSPSNGLSNPSILSPIANPSVTTTYTVEVFDQFGNYCVNNVTIEPIQFYTLNWNLSDNDICFGESITLGAQCSPSNGNWVLSSSSNQSWSYPTSLPTLYPNSSTTFTLQIPNNNCTSVVNSSVTVYPNPTVAVSPPAEVCVGEAVNINLSTQSGNITTWYNSSGAQIGSGSYFVFNPQYSQNIQYNVSNSAGCSTTGNINVSVNPNCCSLSNLPPYSSTVFTSPLNITGQNYTFNSDLIMDGPVTLVITQSNLKFAQNCGIVLKNGADLRVEASVLTNLSDCPHPWKGIGATHTSYYSSNNLDETSITIKNSIISHAHKGINLLSLPIPQQSGTPLGNSPWVYVNCMDSKFEDNVKDCNLEGVSTQNQLSAVFTKCKFTITSNYPNYLYHELNRISLLNNQNTYVFNACQFLNDKPNFLIGSTELCAIHSNRCGLRISSPVSTVQNSPNSSLFKGFTRGVVHLGGDELIIENSDFRCVRSVFQSGCIGNVSISKCRFVNLPLNFIPTFANPFIQNNGGGANEPLPGELPNNSIHYGCYLDGCIGKISFIDNYVNTNRTFSGYPATPFLTSASNITEHGVILNQCQTKYGLIARNTFTQMKRAIKFQGQNKIDLQSGVKYTCNTFFGNGKDIIELQGASALLLAGVPNQNINLKDPNNIFNFSLETNDDIHNSNNLHDYTRIATSSSPSDFESVNINFISAQPQNIVNCFTLSFGNSIEENYQLYHDINEYWSSTKDGGNTQELVTVIQSADFSSTLSDLYDVVQASPLLSNEAVAEMLDNQNIPNYILSQLISYNASVMREPEFVEKMNNRAISFSDFEQQIIDQGLNLWTSKDYLMNQLAYLEEEHNYLMNEIAMTNDSILSEEQRDSILQENTYPSTFKSDYRKEILHFISEGRFDDAQNLLANFEQWFNYLPSEKDEYNELLSLLSILSSSDTVSYTEFIHLNNVQSIFSKKACYAYLGDSISTISDVIFEERENRSGMLNNTSTLQLETRIFPNPTSGDFFNIELPYSDCFITISNNLGEIVYSKKYISNFELIRVNTGDLSQGVYLIMIQNLKTGKTENYKLIIQ
jgi:hypothetical protein